VGLFIRVGKGCGSEQRLLTAQEQRIICLLAITQDSARLRPQSLGLLPLLLPEQRLMN